MSLHIFYIYCRILDFLFGNRYFLKGKSYINDMNFIISTMQLSQKCRMAKS